MRGLETLLRELEDELEVTVKDFKEVLLLVGEIVFPLYETARSPE